MYLPSARFIGKLFQIIDILFVQEVVTGLYSNLLYKMGHYFLDT